MSQLPHSIKFSALAGRRPPTDVTCATHLECVYCLSKFPLADYFEGCPTCAIDGWRANLSVRYDYERAAQAFRDLPTRSARGVWGYAPLLPVGAPGPELLLGEGNTPLVQIPRLAATLNLSHIWVKDESRNPTWSHKDRLATVGIARAMGSAPSAVTVASTGNHGAATAAYGARAGLRTVVFTSQGTPPVMEALLRAYGAAVVRVASKERRWELMTEAVRAFRWFPMGTFAPHRVGNPYGLEGYKTISYEIWRDLGRVPEWVVVPVSTGDALYGIWKGFWELHQMNVTSAIPRMLAVEISGPLERAMRQGLDRVESVPGRPSIAFSIGGNSAGHHALVSLRASSGAAVTVDDPSILEAQAALAREGLFVEPAAAATIAGLRRMVEAGRIKQDGPVVCILTSGGLKDPSVNQKGEEAPLFTGPLEALPGYLRAHYQFSP